MVAAATDVAGGQNESNLRTASAALRMHRRRLTFLESFVLVDTQQGWKIALRHPSVLPPDFGVEVKYQEEHGGAKIAGISKGGPAEKAGLKSGDVLIEYGGSKIDNPDDLYNRWRGP